MADDGKVVYKVEVDDKEVPKQLNDVNSKIEKSSNQTSEKQKKDFKETSKEFEKQTKKIQTTNKETNKKIVDESKITGTSLKDTFSGVADEIGISFSNLTKAGVVAGITGLATKAVSSAVDLDKAMNQFASSTGTSTNELKKYEDVLKNIYGNNYGDDFLDIANAMGEVKKQMGNLDEATLQNLTESAFALRGTFEYDVKESVRASKAMMDNFGISGEEAMNLIANGAQNGLDYSEEFLDSISEYSVQFAKLGLDADDMFKIFEKGSKNGAFNLDKIGDAVKEFGIRVIDGSDTTIAGFEAIGLNADEMAKKFAKGGDSAKKAFNETITALVKMKDPLEQNTAGVNLFGTMWEDLGVDAISALAGIEDGAYGTADAMNNLKEVKYDDLGSMFEGLTRQLELLLLPLGEALMPILSDLIQAVLPVLQTLLPPLIEALNAVITPILGIITALTPLIETITASLMPIIETLGQLFAEVFGAIGNIVVEVMAGIIDVLSPFINFILELLTPAIKTFASMWIGSFSELKKDISNIINNIKGILKGIIDFVTGVFTGNWKKAWNGVVSIFSNIFGALANMWKAPINAIIGGLNSFINGINNIKVPSWVPVVGGKGVSIPNIPRLKVGMDFVPSDFYPAYLDYGEAVLTKEENAKLRSWGGIDGVEKLMTSSTINNDLSIDYTRLAKAMEDVNIRLYMDKKVVGQSVTSSVDENMGIITSRKGRYGI